MTTTSRNRLASYATDPLAFFDDLIIASAHGPQRFGDCMADFQRERFQAISPALIAVARGEKPPCGRYWWESTKGGSKDSDATFCDLWLTAFSNRRLTIQYAASDRDQAAEPQKICRDTLRLNSWLSTRIEMQSWKTVCRATGTESEIIAADVAGSHGARPDFLILQELSHIPKREFAENLIDNAAKVPRGLVIVATNAGFLSTWQHSWRQIAETSDRWSTHILSRPAPWLDAAEIAEAEHRNSRSRFRRLFWGEWVSAASDALNETDVAAMFADGVPQLDTAADGYAFSAGLDLSISRDHSAFVIVGKHATGRYRVARCWLWKPPAPGLKIDLEQVENTVRDAAQRFGLVKIAADPYQSEYLCSRLAKTGVPIEPRPQTGKALVEQCCALLEQINSRNIDSHRFEPLERDLRSLQVEERSYGLRLVSSRNGEGHGDIVTATSLSLVLAKGLEVRPSGPNTHAPFVIPTTNPPGRARFDGEPFLSGTPIFLNNPRRRW